MIQYLGKFLEIAGLLLAGSGIIGDTRLRAMEVFVGNQLEDFLSRKGFQDFLQTGGVAAENQGTFFAKLFSFLLSFFRYLSAIASILLSFSVIVSLIFPTMRKIIVDLFVNNKELLISILRTGGYLLGFCFVGLFLSLFITPILTKQPMIKPLSWFVRKSTWYSDNLNSAMESVRDKIFGTLTERIGKPLNSLPKPANKWLQRLIYLPFTLLLKILIVILILIFIGFPLILWWGFWSILSSITGFFVISLFFTSLSILQIIVLVLFAIAYAIARVLFLPYAVVERLIKRTYPELAPGSTFIITGYLLSIIGILLQ